MPFVQQGQARDFDDLKSQNYNSESKNITETLQPHNDKHLICKTLILSNEALAI